MKPPISLELREEMAQECANCGELTGKCSEDSLFLDDVGPLCEACLDRVDLLSSDEIEEADYCNSEFRAGRF